MGTVCSGLLKYLSPTYNCSTQGSGTVWSSTQGSGKVWRDFNLQKHKPIGMCEKYSNMQNILCSVANHIKDIFVYHRYHLQLLGVQHHTKASCEISFRSLRAKLKNEQKKHKLCLIMLIEPS